MLFFFMEVVGGEYFGDSKQVQNDPDLPSKKLIKHKNY